MWGLKIILGQQIKSLLRVIDVFTKYACVKPLKDQKCRTVIHGFIELVNESNCKPNKVWVDQGKEFYNSPVQKWLDDNDILMYSTHNDGKFVVVERFIKTLKGKISKGMTANDSKSYLSYLNKSVDQYNNTYHCSTGKNPIDVDYSDLTEETELSFKAP